MYRSLLLFLLLCVGCAPKKSVQKATLPAGFAQTFEHQINSLYHELDLASDLLVGVVDSTGLIYTYVIQGKTSSARAPITSASPFYLGSHTKSMTGTLLQILEEEGLLHVDSPVSNYLPELHFNSKIDTRSITLRHLLSHTHGIQNTALTWVNSYLGHTGDDAELIRILNTSSTYDSTRAYRYSNIGPIIAGMVVRKVTGKDWRDAMEEKLFKPLHMSQTSDYVSHYAPSQLVPTDIQRQPDGSVTAHFFKTDHTMHPAGGTVSTLQDLANWMMFNLNNGQLNGKQLVSKAGMQNLHHASASQEATYFVYPRFGYSTGWDLATYNGDTLLTRFGGFLGTSFHLSFLPKQKLGLIAFTNEAKAYRVPHLSANLAYNLLLHKSNWQEKFEAEKQFYLNALQKQEQTSPPTSKPDVSSYRNLLTGKYLNSLGWPPITIKAVSDNLTFRWGELIGNVTHAKKMDSSLILTVDFQLLTRDFTFPVGNVAADSLKTGSISYSREK